MTVTVNGYSGTYDGQSHSGSATSNITAGTTISYSTDGGKTWTTEAPSIKDVGEITVKVKVENPNYKTVEDSYVLKVAAKAVTVTANDNSKVYGEADPKLTATVKGLVTGESIEYSVSRASGENVGKYAITASGEAVQGNYTVTYKAGTFTISKATTGFEVTGEGYNAPYDGQPHGTAATANVTEGTTFTYSTDGGTTWTDKYPTITDKGRIEVKVKAENPNYEPVENTYVLEVTAKAVTVTANNNGKVYNTADPELTATVEGLVGEDTISYSVTRASGENVGTYAITASGEATQGNYAVTYKPGTFTISKATTGFEVTGEGYNAPYDGQPHGTGATANVTEGTTITYSTDGGTTWTDKYPTITDKGRIEVKVKAENPNYEPVENSYVLEVKSATVTITADPITKAYNTADPELTATVEGLVGTDTVEYQLSRESGEKVGTYDIIVSGTKEQGNYTLVLVNGYFTITETGANPVVKTHTNKEYALGETVMFTITVENIFKDAQTITIVEQDGVKIDGENVFEDVEPGETVSVNAKYVITEADILRGKFSNTANAKFSGGKEFFGQDETAVEEINSSIKVTIIPNKTGDVSEGEEITYTIIVENTGNVTYHNVVVTDPLTGFTTTIDELGVGGDNAQSFETTHEVSRDDINNGKVHNEVTVTADPIPDPNPNNPKHEVNQTEENDISTKSTASVKVTKTADKQRAKVGETVTYTVSVENTGNVDLKNITVTDKLIPGWSFEIDTLDAGSAPAVTTVEYVVSETDMVDGKISNTVVAEQATDPERPDAPKIDQTSGSADVTVVYTVHYLVAGDAASSKDVQYAIGEKIEPYNPTMVGYHIVWDNEAPDVMGAEDVTVNGHWEINIHTFTIHYVYEDYSWAAPDYKEQVEYGGMKGVGITSPTIKGYTPDWEYVTLGTEGMPDNDVEVWVVYSSEARGNTGGVVNGYQINSISKPEVPTTFIDSTHNDSALIFIFALVSMITQFIYADKKKKYQERELELRKELSGEEEEE